MTSTIIQNTTLYFRQGSSDKVYQVAIEEAPGEGNAFLVTFAYGRRGATLKTGTKTQQPVIREKAVAIYDKIIASKQAKGYSPGEDGAPYVGTAAQNNDTDIRCQLANPVDESGLATLLDRDFTCMQEKFDGRRMLLRKDAEGAITGINRRGLAIAVPVPIRGEALKLRGAFLLDGEAVGDTLHVFDLLEDDGEDLRGMPCIDRLNALAELLRVSGEQLEAIKLVSTAFHVPDKKKVLQSLRRRGAEGVVFKRSHSQYRPGRPASGGDWIKFKFVETASFIVAEINTGKRSVALELLDETGQRVPAGNVTIPPNRSIPDPGTVLEVRYLHAFRQSGVIYQPVFLGMRDDIPAEECTTDQLKFKPVTG